MQITTTSNSVNNTGLATEDISIKISPATFKLIFSSIYEKKELAVIRELAANALDSHIYANKADVPVEITLPTDMNPFLVVSDFGTGMDFDTIHNVFFELFNSTKSSDNNGIGGFGIGSKAPYAISESYTLSTVKDNKRTEVIMSMDNGVPKPVVVAQEVYTDQPNGTTVTVPVNKQSSREEMKNIVSYLFNYWEVSPLVDGKLAHNIVNTKFMETNHYAKDLSYWRSQNLVSSFREVLVGPFVYSIPEALRTRLRDKIEAEYKESSSFIANNILNKTEIVLSTKIGDLELAPSRERIEDTDENYKHLYALLVELISTIMKSYSEVTEKVLEFIEDNTPDNLDKYGYTFDQQNTIKDFIVQSYGAEHIAIALLSRELVEKSARGKALFDKLSVIRYSKYRHTRSSDEQPTSLYQYFVPGNFVGYNYYLSRLELKELAVSNVSVVRKQKYSGLINSVSSVTKSQIVVMVDAASMSNSDKAKFNYTFRTSSIAHNGVNLTEENYVEVHSETDIPELKHIMKTYLSSVYKVIEFSDIESQLLKVPKSTRTSSSSRKSTVPADNRQVALNYNFYNVDSLNIDTSAPTVHKLYNTDEYKDLDIIVVPKYLSSSATSVWRFATDWCKRKPTLILEVLKKETNTKRFKKLESKVTIFDSGTSHFEIVNYLLDVDATNISKLQSLQDYFYRKVIDKTLLPKKYHYLWDYYDVDKIDTYSLPYLSHNSSIILDNLYKKGSKEYKLIEVATETSGNPKRAIHEFLVEMHLPLYKRVIAKSLKTFK